MHDDAPDDVARTLARRCSRDHRSAGRSRRAGDGRRSTRATIAAFHAEHYRTGERGVAAPATSTTTTSSPIERRSPRMPVGDGPGARRRRRRPPSRRRDRRRPEQVTLAIGGRAVPRRPRPRRPRRRQPGARRRAVEPAVPGDPRASGSPTACTRRRRPTPTPAPGRSTPARCPSTPARSLGLSTRELDRLVADGLTDDELESPTATSPGASRWARGHRPAGCRASAGCWPTLGEVPPRRRAARPLGGRDPDDVAG